MLQFNMTTFLWLSVLLPFLNNIWQEISTFFSRLCYKTITIKSYNLNFHAVKQFITKKAVYIDTMEQDDTRYGKFGDNFDSEYDEEYDDYNSVKESNKYLEYNLSKCTKNLELSHGKYYIRHKGNLFTVSYNFNSEEGSTINISAFLNKNFNLILDLIHDAELQYKKIDKNEKKVGIFHLDDRKEWYFAKTTQLPSISHIILKEEEKKSLLESMDVYHKNKKKYNRLMISYKYGILLDGLHGTGKTTLAKALCSEFEMERIYAFDLTNEKIWESISNIRPKSMIIIEDIDRYFEPIRSNSASAEIVDYKPLFDLNKFINFLDGLNSPNSCVICMTVNDSKKVPPVVFRPGRIQKVVKFGYASFEEIKNYTHFFYQDSIAPSCISHEKLLNEYGEKMGEILQDKVTISELQNHFLNYIDDFVKAYDNKEKIFSIKS